MKRRREVDYGIQGRPSHLRNDCTVRAMVIATGMDYILCATAIALCGRRNNCGSHMADWVRAFRKFGQCLTENQINLKYEKIEGNVIVMTRGHLYAIKDGIHSDGPYAHSMNNGKRIRLAWRIV